MRFIILPDNPMAIRDTETGINYYTIGATDAIALYLLLSTLEKDKDRLKEKIEGLKDSMSDYL